MRRAILASAVLVGLGSILLTTVPAHAEYGAIAWDAATGKTGASWHDPTAEDVTPRPTWVIAPARKPVVP
jgi:hypothetical protein